MFVIMCDFSHFCIAFSALTLLVGRQEGHLEGHLHPPPIKNMGGGGGGHWLVRMEWRPVSVSASVNLPLHHKVQKFSSGAGSPGWSRKRAVKRLWWWWFLISVLQLCSDSRLLNRYVMLCCVTVRLIQNTCTRQFTTTGQPMSAGTTS